MPWLVQVKAWPGLAKFRVHRAGHTVTVMAWLTHHPRRWGRMVGSSQALAVSADAK